MTIFKIYFCEKKKEITFLDVKINFAVLKFSSTGCNFSGLPLEIKT